MASALMLTGVLGFTASPAQAATGTHCANWQQKNYSPPGKHPVTVIVKVCIYSSYLGSGMYGRTPWIEYTWESAYGGVKWDNFGIRVRLENYDNDLTTDYCNFTYQMNHSTSGREICYAPSWNSTSVGGFTADGHIRWNYNSDGEGDYIWSLTGSPQVS
ncbi:hypothetical protein [Catellatospora chokoriensis]|uniref:hypothetical protein n=1 Tax=Catellatospora chokoriensis TaxID=310353 RepID=UPI00177F8657|nr:hypothetical protein [Catellatospora chokoriensis]